MAQDIPDNMEFTEEFTDRAWQDMKGLLDKEMPVEVPTKRRKGAWIWLLLLLWMSMGIGFVCVLKDSYFAQYQDGVQTDALSENTILPPTENNNEIANVIPENTASIETGIFAENTDNQANKQSEQSISKDNTNFNTLPNMPKQAKTLTKKSVENNKSNSSLNTLVLSENTLTNKAVNTPIINTKSTKENINENSSKSNVPSTYSEVNTSSMAAETIINSADKSNTTPVVPMTLPEPPVRTAPVTIPTPVEPVKEATETAPKPPFILEDLEKALPIDKQIAEAVAEQTAAEKDLEALRNAAKNLTFAAPVEMLTDKMIAVLPEQAPILDREIEVKKERSVLPLYWTVSATTRFYGLPKPNAYTIGLDGFYRLRKSKCLIGTGLHATYLNEPITGLQTVDFNNNDSMTTSLGTENIPVGDELFEGVSMADALLSYQQKSIYVEVPLFINWAVRERFQVQAGLNTSVLLFSNPLNFGLIQSSDESKNVDRYVNNVNIISSMALLRRMDLTPMVGISFLPNSRLGIDLRYQHGIIDLSNAVTGAQVNSNVQLGVSYWFGK